MTSELETGIPAPRVRSHKRRVTAEVAAMKEGQSIVVDTATSRALVAYARYHGWVYATESQLGGLVRFWRLG